METTNPKIKMKELMSKLRQFWTQKLKLRKRLPKIKMSSKLLTTMKKPQKLRILRKKNPLFNKNFTKSRSMERTVKSPWMN